MNTIKQHQYTIREIQNIFRMDEKVKSRQTIFNAEQRGEIPTAKRIIRGKVNARSWSSNQLPGIGRRFGFLSPNTPIGPEIISVFTQKGGTLKSTLTYSLARGFALNNKKVLIIGLDSQASVTMTTLGQRSSPESLQEYRKQREQWGGLYHLIYQDSVQMSDVVHPTSLPTLDIIPEVGELAELERRLQGADGREKIFQKKLLPLIKGYDIVIFDNGPSWNQLVRNSLVAATTVISPIGCDLGTYEVLDINMQSVTEFRDALDLK